MFCWKVGNGIATFECLSPHAFSVIYTIIDLTNEAISAIIDHSIWWYKSLHIRVGQEIIFISCKNFHNFKTIPVQNQDDPRGQKFSANEASHSSQNRHQRKTKYSFGICLEQVAFSEFHYKFHTL